MGVEVGGLYPDLWEWQWPSCDPVVSVRSAKAAVSTQNQTHPGTYPTAKKTIPRTDACRVEMVCVEGLWVIRAVSGLEVVILVLSGVGSVRL